MKKFMTKQSLAVVALLCSSTGFAASVTVTSLSNPAPNVGDTFTLLVKAIDFPNTVGATLKLIFNSANVQLSTPAVGTGIALAAGSPLTGGVAIAPGPAANFTSGSIFSVLAPTVGTLPTGSFDAFVISFKALAAGAAGIVVSDDGADFTWSDEFSAPIAVSYTQANVVVQGAVVPAPAALWLLGTGVIALAGRRLSRKAA